MAIKMVRQPSDTPNINNVDDFIPFRYAYGDQSGYVIGKGSELSSSVIGNTFRINGGRAVIQGVECDIDANGYDIIIDDISSTRYHSIYLEVNLALMTIDIKETSDGAVYPTIDVGDDLTQNSSGIARLLLYNIQSNAGVISNVQKKINAIEYSGTALVGYDINKGTIEQRLTNLGFKQGSVILGENITATHNELTRQGNYVLGNVILNMINYREPESDISNPIIDKPVVFSLPDEFRPKDNTTPISFAFAEGNFLDGVYAGRFNRKLIPYQYTYYSNDFTFTVLTRDTNASYTINLTFGYEAEPIS